MKQLKLDTGLVSYKLMDGVLRFNPSDPNLYLRFRQAMDKLSHMEKALPEQLQAGDLLTVMGKTDREMKELLGWVFGPGNDFDAICGGVSLLGVAGDGRTVADNLFAVLEPILLEGAQRCAKQQADSAKALADQRRQSR